MQVCVETWTRMKVAVNDPDDPELNGATPRHLLWALLFLKKYGDEAEMATLAGCDEKTFRKWSEIFVIRVASLIGDVVRDESSTNHSL